MVTFSDNTKVYLYPSSISFRCGIRSLSELILNEGIDIKDSVFIFFSKDKTSIKMIEFDENGVWLYQKSLNGHRFLDPSVKDKTIIDIRQLQIILHSLKTKKKHFSL